MKANNPAAELFAAAFQQHQAGALREAEQTYKRVLALDPAHVDALHFLGVLAMQAGRNDIAVELIGRAISLNGRIPECHYNIGIALRRARPLRGSGRAQSQGDRPQARLCRGLSQSRQRAEGQGQARTRPNRIMKRRSRLKPELAAAHFNLANVLSDEGALDRSPLALRKGAGAPAELRRGV